MGRVKTFTNGGQLFPSDIDAIEDDYEYAFSIYKPVVEIASRLDAPAAGTFLLIDGSTGAGVAPTAAQAGVAAFYYDPADWTVGAPNTRTTRMRVRFALLVNATAPAANFTAGLYPISAPAGAAATVSVTAGAVVNGSTATLGTPAAGAAVQSNSGDFSAPTAGWYALGVVVSANCAVGSAVAACARLQVRQT